MVGAAFVNPPLSEQTTSVSHLMFSGHHHKDTNSCKFVLDSSLTASFKGRSISLIRTLVWKESKHQQWYSRALPLFLSLPPQQSTMYHHSYYFRRQSRALPLTNGSVKVPMLTDNAEVSSVNTRSPVRRLSTPGPTRSTTYPMPIIYMLRSQGAPERVPRM